MKPSRTSRRKPDFIAPEHRFTLPVRIFQIIFSIAIAAASQYLLMYGLPAIVRMIAKGIK